MAKKKSKKKLYIYLGIIAVLLVVFLFMFVINQSEPAISVNIAKVEKRTITQTVSAIGKIQPETEVKISPETSGEIISLFVREGDTVQAGKLLVRIKPDIIETQLAQFKAAAESAKMEIEVRKAERDWTKNDLQRKTELFSKEYISKEEFDRIKTAYSQAESSYSAALSRYDQALASFRQIERAAERTTIFSPMDGVITSLTVEKGEKVVGTEMMQGTEMMRISDLSVINAVVEVDENDIILVKIGDTATVEIDAIPEKKYTGIVYEIGHSAIQSGFGTQEQVTNFQVKIRMLDHEPRLRPGMSCNVEIKTETKYNIIAVPLQSVTVRDTSELKTTPDIREEGISKVENGSAKSRTSRQPSVVFIRDGNQAKMVKVETGLSDRGFIEITSGLNEGDEVVSGSFMAISKMLFDGAAIKVDTTSRARSFKRD